MSLDERYAVMSFFFFSVSLSASLAIFTMELRGIFVFVLHTVVLMDDGTCTILRLGGSAGQETQ